MSAVQRFCAIAAAVLIAVALLALRPSGEPGVAMRDFEAYYSAGATWLAHGDAYSTAIWEAQRQIPGVVAERREMLPFVGLPATLPLWSLFARLPYAEAARVWSAVLVLALLAIVAATLLLLRLPFARGAIVALLALAFVPITSDFVLGQAAMPAYAAALVALWAPPVWSALATAFGALQPNVALGLLAAFGQRERAIAIAGGACAVYIIGAFAAGAGWPIAYVSTLAAHAQAERFAAIQYTPAAVLYAFGVPQNAASVVAWIIAGAAVALAAVGARRTADMSQRFAIVCCAIPFVAGFFHEHDFVVMFFPALFALAYAEERYAGLATFATLLVGVNWLDFAQQPQGALQDVTLAAALVAAACALRPQPRIILPALASAGVLAIGVWIGTTHPLPIWPNDMAAAAPAAGTTIAEIWKNEQLQTGLLRPDAAAALLRTLALAGSALLFYLTLNIDVHHVVERRDRVGAEVL